MTGKGRYHEGIQSQSSNWLHGMTFRKSEMCDTVADNSHCAHYRTSKGCGFAHTSAEMLACRETRFRFVKGAIAEREWPWYEYHWANSFKGDGTPLSGPALSIHQNGDHDYRYK
eukprot:6309476-Heterocapsa_arctica.AAC.1